MDYIVTMRVFVNVVKVGNFVRTAETMACSASSISKSISNLEARLHCKLFLRSTRHIELSEAGEVFYQHAVQILESIENAENQVDQLINSARGNLRVSAPASLVTLFEKQGFIDHFLGKYPDISLDLALDDRNVDIVMEGFDLALRVAVKLPDSSLVAKKLHSFKVILCCSPKYLLNNPKLTRLQDVSKHNCLIYNPATLDRQWFLQKAGKITVLPVAGNLASNNIDVIRNSALMGTGITMMPAAIIHRELQSGELVQLFPSYSSVELNLYAMYPDRRWTPKKTTLFIDYLSASAGAWQG